MKPRMKPGVIASLVIAGAALAGPLAHAGDAVASAATPSTGTYYLQVSNDLVGNAYADFRRQLSNTVPAPSPEPAPEPARYGMMLAGLGVLGVVARRRKGRSRP